MVNPTPLLSVVKLTLSAPASSAAARQGLTASTTLASLIY